MTNKIVLKSVDEFMADYQPVYQPIFPLFLGKSKQYDSTVGVQNFKRLEAVGDIRNRHITPKDTEIKQIGVREGSKTFKKYFLGSQYTESDLQDHERVNDVAAQVLDEHNKHQDDLLFLGEGTSASTMVNNGLFWSSDSNYVLESSSALSAGSDTHLSSMHAAMITSAMKANKVAGRKVMFVYGSTLKPKYNSLYAATSVPFKEALAKVLGPNWFIVEVPDDIAISGDGWICCNMDQILFHYSLVPQLKNSGMNDEKGYAWWNFLMGSTMLEVLALYGIVRQPVTFS